MNEFIKVLIERLEEYVQASDKKYHYLVDNAELNCLYDKSDLEDMRKQTFKETISIVNQLAEEQKQCVKSSCSNCETYDNEKHYCPK